MIIRAESEILKAFDAIHSLNIIHDDVRAGNILVSEDGNTTWIIDFEFAEIIKDDDVRESLISKETQVVRELLEGFKIRHRENDFHEYPFEREFIS